MTHSIEFAKEAESDFAALVRSARRLAERVLAKIEFLSISPTEGKPLAGNHKGEFSLSVGSCRIIYELDTAQHVVYILTIKHRKHVYQ